MYKSSLLTEISFADEIQIMKILFAAFSLDTVIANTSVMSPPSPSRLSRMDFHSHHKTFSHSSGCEVKSGWALWCNCSDTTIGFKNELKCVTPLQLVFHPDSVTLTAITEVFQTTCTNYQWDNNWIYTEKLKNVQEGFSRTTCSCCQTVSSVTQQNFLFCLLSLLSSFNIHLPLVASSKKQQPIFFNPKSLSFWIN